MIENLNKYIDHTLLKANATKSEIKNLCEQAKEYNFFSVCVNPINVKLAKELLEQTQVKVCTVVGFPLGQNEMTTKMFEAQMAVENGADEIDMVINVAKLIDGDYDYVEQEIKSVHSVLNENTTLKVIIETCYLNTNEIVKATEICEKAGANFVKTSTGFGTRGASIEDVKTIKSAIKGNIGIKASGGIKTRELAESLIEAGATRIGTSSGVAIVNEKKELDMCLFKRKKKAKTSFQDWHNNINNFGFNEKYNSLSGSFQNASANGESLQENNDKIVKNDSNNVNNDNNISKNVNANDKNEQFTDKK